LDFTRPLKEIIKSTYKSWPLQLCDNADALFDNKELLEPINNATLQTGGKQFYYCAPKSARDSVFIGNGVRPGITTMNAYRIKPCDDAWNKKNGINATCLPKEEMEREIKTIIAIAFAD
jgi:hypothetical protein